MGSLVTGLRWLGRLSAVLGMTLLGTIVWGSIHYDFVAEGSQLLDLYWGRVTLFDFYIGVVFVAAWVFYRESRFGVAVLWTMGLIGLGHLVTCFYVWRAVQQANGDTTAFWRGTTR